MGSRIMWRLLVLAVALGLPAPPSGASVGARRPELDVREVYERLGPGMAVSELAAVVGEGRLAGVALPAGVSPRP